jgi:serine protease Do
MTLPGLRVLRWVGIVVVLTGFIAVAAMSAPGVRGQTMHDQVMTGQLLGWSGIGVRVRDVEAADVTRGKLSAAAGAVIDDVTTDSPADKAGMKVGDIVVGYDGDRVKSARQFARLVQETPEGREVEASVVRNGDKVTVKVTPAAPETLRRALEPLRNLRNNLNDRLALAMPRNGAGVMGRLAARSRGRLGVTVEDLSDQLGEFLGSTGGVLVTSVDASGPGRAAGLKAGDVITKVNGQAVNDTIQLRARLAAAPPEATITIVRDHKEQTLTAKLE